MIQIKISIFPCIVCLIPAAVGRSTNAQRKHWWEKKLLVDQEIFGADIDARRWEQTKPHQAT